MKLRQSYQISITVLLISICTHSRKKEIHIIEYDSQLPKSINLVADCVFAQQSIPEGGSILKYNAV
jgi:hypothetical protein